MPKSEIYVYVGPSCRSKDIELLSQIRPDVTFLPPAARGDLIELANYLSPEATVLIIDGYFSQDLSVWHNEFLYASNKRIKIYGCSSMGALRAAELFGFGVKGFGRIFDYFHTAIHSFDDEVALSHAPAENDYAPISFPLINLRISGQDMVDNKIITTRQFDLLMKIGRSTPYYERNLDLILKAYIKSNNFQDESKQKSHHMQIISGIIDIKRYDALSAISMVTELTNKQIHSLDDNLGDYLERYQSLFNVKWDESNFYEQDINEYNLPFATFKIRELRRTPKQDLDNKISGCDIRDYLVLSDENFNLKLRTAYMRALLIQVLKMNHWKADLKMIAIVKTNLLNHYDCLDCDELARKLLLDEQELEEFIESQALLDRSIQNHAARHWINSSVKDICDLERANGTFINVVHCTSQFLSHNHESCHIDDDEKVRRIQTAERLRSLDTEILLKLSGFVDEEDLERTLYRYLSILA